MPTTWTLLTGWIIVALAFTQHYYSSSVEQRVLPECVRCMHPTAYAKLIAALRALPGDSHTVNIGYIPTEESLRFAEALSLAMVDCGWAPPSRYPFQSRPMIDAGLMIRCRWDRENICDQFVRAFGIAGVEVTEHYLLARPTQGTVSREPEFELFIGDLPYAPQPTPPSQSESSKG